MSTLTALRQALARAEADRITLPHPRYVAVADKLVAVLERYFRATVLGLDNLPQGAALLVGNHNAGITFFEPFFLGRAWHRRSGGRDPIYFLGHDAMVALPLLGRVLTRLGVIRASHDAAGRAFAAGHKVMVFPGGNYEAFRPFRERHRIDFGGKTGFVKLALRHGVPLVPVLALGGHETFFVLHRGEKLAALTGAKRYLRSESFPVFVGLPWGIGIGPIFHWPLPAKTLVEVGVPMSLASYGPAAESDPEVVAHLAREVERRLQEMMDRRAADRRWPILG